MALKSLIKFFFRRFLEILIVLVLILVIPNLPPNGTYHESYKVTPAKALEGALKLNGKLDDVEQWHKGDLFGPEAFATYKGEVYTGLHGGDVVKLVGNHITPVVKFGKPCKHFYEESLCGRPLGLRFGQDGTLYVADAYYGIFKVNVQTGDKELLVSPEQLINGKQAKLFNSIAVAKSGDVFWTDSSSQFHLEDGVFDLLADPSGRLVKYDAKTQKNTVLIDRLHFANGVVLSQGEDFVLVSETGRNRIHKHHLKGPKAGQNEVFIDGLPGMPDNLSEDGQGGFFAPLVFSVDEENPNLIQVLSEFPLARKLISRIFGLIELGFKGLDKVYPCGFAQHGKHFIGHFTSTSKLMVPARVTILRLNGKGQIIDSLHTTNRKLSSVCEVHVVKDQLYLASPFNDYIGRVSLKKVGWTELEKKKIEVETPKPVPSTPKPTTTTQKPTTTTPKPATTTTQPKTTAKPVTTTPKPAPTTAKPKTTPPKTVPTTSKPATTTPPKPTPTKPTTTQAKP